MDFIKDKSPENQFKFPDAVKWRWMVLLLIFFVFISVFAFAYYYRRDTFQLGLVPDYYARISAWVSERKSHLNQGIVKVKHLSLNKEGDDDALHFEFYTALPNMQIEITEPDVKEKHLPVIPQVERKQLAKSNAPAIKPEELERKLSHQLKEKTYILQLGIFHQATVAERYRKKLSRAGHHASIVKTNSGKKTIYRLQQGPFLGLHQAKLVQQKLKKKGFSSLVRNVERG